MCGICLSLNFCQKSIFDEFKNESSLQHLHLKLKQRGPNYFQKISHSFSDVFHLNFISSVLHLRGISPSLQPVTDDAGNVLMWNGEIFGGPLFEQSQSDVKVLSEKLFCCTETSHVISVISSIEGPFAFVFYQNNGLVWFGRDIFGRRSLLWKADDTAFHLSSISSLEEEWKEVPAAGVFCLNLKQSNGQQCFAVNFYPWSSTPSGFCSSQKIDDLYNIFSNVIITVASDVSIKNPILKPLNRLLPSDEILKDLWVPNEDIKSKNYFPEDVFKRILETSLMDKAINEFGEMLSNAVKKRVQNHQHICKNCYSSQENVQSCRHTSVGILFSGGLDSIVIACLADRHLDENEPIDLLNIAFASNFNLKKSKSTDNHLVFETPDRVTGRNGVIALRRVCPKRKWNFVEVNISEEDLINQRRDVISHLLRPSCTVLDDSIGCAIWFAARGSGIVTEGDDYENYNSPARVLLVGMGADEQLGGYSRHRVKFNSLSWGGVVEELTLELDRISSRNLGRDDRIIADHGVESRYPFLDETVVSYLNSLPVWLKMNLNYPRGIGEKLLLRLLAYKLGLTEAAALPKRAIQFGSRIAKIENSKEKGSDICERLKNL
ncbi:asparagine synthetase domain-containing protein 1 [Caerostris darwini]|uniref:Asparagine synthetase domain-containing protein 1 n=1 Tax=Caerostris darwini TaxID=1538125 RepID=A0AAV4W1W6_9ARAC|nr:asparagine synthetase domain-containing protein 1 [Caerostris darwini]